MLKNAKNGIALLEMIMVCLIGAILTIATAEMIAQAFDEQVNYDKNLSAKQDKNIISERIASKAKEATKVYYNGLNLSISYNGSTYALNPEVDSLAVLIPKYDSNGNLIRVGGSTTFKGVAFSIIPNPEEDDGTYVLVETDTEFTLPVLSTDPINITGTLPADWSGGDSRILAKNLRPGNFPNMGNFAFDVEGDMVNFAFVPQGGDVYFASDNGAVNIDDGQYITRCQFRNYRI